MNQISGWMSGWADGAILLWAMIDLAVVVLLVVVIIEVSKNNFRAQRAYELKSPQMK